MTAAVSNSLPGVTATIDTPGVDTYTDMNALSSLKRDPDSPEALKAVAQQVEALFLQMMLKSLREASASINPDSNEMGMYEDMYDKQVALSLSAHTDLGIARMLEKKLSNRAPRTPGLPSESAPSARSLAATPEQFVHRVAAAATEAAHALGIDPEALIAQAALETGWGQRMASNADGSPSNNLFGIKAGEEWPGPKASAESLEVVDGVAVPRRTAFRSYGSVEESTADFAKLLATSPRYREVLTAGGDPQAYAAAMGRSGYATDPAYGNKLSQILKSGAIRTALAARIAKL